MKQRQSIVTAFALALAATGLLPVVASAGERNVTLSVDGMWCPSCGFIVEESLARVQGVTDVEVSMWERVAYVTFDDEIATIETLTGATSEVGFPSIPIEEGG